MNKFKQFFRSIGSRLEASKRGMTAGERFHTSFGGLAATVMMILLNGLSLPSFFMLGATGFMTYRFYQEFKQSTLTN